MEIIASEEADLKNKKELIVETCTMLDKEFVDCVNAAEKENNMQLVIKATALKRKSNEKNAEIAEIEKADKRKKSWEIDYKNFVDIILDI